MTVSILLILNTPNKQKNTATPTVTTAYSVTGTTAQGCSQTKSLVVNVNPILFTNNPQSVCKGSIYTLNSHSYSVAGIYKDTLTSHLGCDSIINTQLTIETINKTVTQNGLTLTANGIADSYQWINCNTNSIISGAVNQSYTTTSNGNYAVILLKNSCQDTSACFNILTTNTSGNELYQKIEIYPNPTNSEITILTEDAQNGANIKLFNVTGQLLLEKNNLIGKVFKVNLTKFANGIYFLEFTRGGKIIREKIVKE